MATKSYKLRLDLRPDQPVVDTRKFGTDRAQEVQQVQRWLDDTREAFNAGVDYLTGWLLRMNRGAGVWREKSGNVWGEWQEISNYQELQDARKKHQDSPDTVALLENKALLAVFTNKGMSEAEAVELAECCRRIAQELCPPEEDSTGQMPRDDLDLLTSATSTAKGIRSAGPTKSGKPRAAGGKRPGWSLGKAVHDEATVATSLDELLKRLEARDEFRSAKRDGQKRIKSLRDKFQQWQWPAAKLSIIEDDKAKLAELVNSSPTLDDLCGKLNTVLTDAQATKRVKAWRKKYSKTEWSMAKQEILAGCRKSWEAGEEKAKQQRAESAESGSVAAYKQLLEADCLPLPGFAAISSKCFSFGALKLDNVGGEWKRSMWNMAGQRVRSHLGWVRRRASERDLWQAKTALFESGGWVRGDKKVKELKADDISPAQPAGEDGSKYNQLPAYGQSEWVKALRQYEEAEMLKHLAGVAFGAAEQPRIRKRTIKGWDKIRGKWRDMLAKAANKSASPPSAKELIDKLNQMRSRKSPAYGDQRVFEWLADPARHWLWDGADHGANNECGREDRDCVSALVAQNEHQSDKPNSITFTRSDPVKHPVWPFFGENSAVKYSLTRGDRLVLTLAQLLCRDGNGAYTAVKDAKIALRGYEDFERSFEWPTGKTTVSAKETLAFRDDLLGGQTRNATLSGMKLIWERDELEAVHRKQQAAKGYPRVFASFSCDAGEVNLPSWLTGAVGSIFKLKKPRDGMTRAFFLKKTITKSDAGADADEAPRLAPGERTWPKEAVDNGFAVRGTDLGLRASSAGVVWRLSWRKEAGKVSWKVGTSDGKDVFAILERESLVLLPGDHENTPEPEQKLRDRFYAVRTRLNLNNALMRIARLLTIENVTTRKRVGEKTRKRKDGTTKAVGVKWTVESTLLTQDEIKANCAKAAEQLVRWAASDAIAESLKAAGGEETLWSALAAADPALGTLAGLVPKTEVPTKKDAKDRGLDWDALKAKREAEDNAFASKVHELRTTLAAAICSGHDAHKHNRATGGLWARFDEALQRELSYSVGKDVRHYGLIRLLRKPPVTRHADRKDVNNLPLGRTHRGGLSMTRLRFLDDVKNFVRRWTCRPRWPGDVRRVPEDAKFDRSDTEHLDHLREHRAKLIAHADVAQALGFDQDLKRGIWRHMDNLWQRPERGHFYRQDGDNLSQCEAPANVEPGHPHPSFAAAHVLVYEDLSRYRMQSDRPKGENSRLALWSHRQILSLAQHIGGLFGMPVATADARFSSRFCSRCGAPGSRAYRFDPQWLSQTWVQRILNSNDIQDASIKSVALTVQKNQATYANEEGRPWVLREDGTHFVCANQNCEAHKKPIDADFNAAANIGLRFLRGMDGIGATVDRAGNILRGIGFVEVGAQVNVGASGEGDDESDGAGVVFRDPSGSVKPKDQWFDPKEFWKCVNISCAKGIQAADDTSAAREDGDED